MVSKVADQAERIRKATSECDLLPDGREFDLAVSGVMRLKGKLAGISGTDPRDMAIKVRVLTESLRRGPLDFSDLAILQSLDDEVARIISPHENLNT